MKLNKQLVTGIWAFAVLGVIVVAFSLFKPSSQSYADVGVVLSDRAEDALVSISIKNRDGSFAVTIEKGEYKCAELEGLPSNDKEFKKLAESVTQLRAIARVKGSSDGEFGFEKPTAVVNAEYSDDTSAVITLGNKTTNGNYYIKIAENGPIYLVADKKAEYFTADIKKFVSLELTDDNNEPESVKYKTSKGNLLIEKMANPYTNGLEETYKYYVQEGENRAYADSAELENTIMSIKGLKAESAAHLFPTDEDFKTYGFNEETNDKVVYTAAGETTTLVLGSRGPDYYYIYRTGIDVIYMIPITSVRWDGANFFSVSTRTLIAPNISEVSGVKVKTLTNEYEVQIKDEQLEYNGNLLDLTKSKELYKAFCGAKAEYELDGEVQNIKPELTITFIYKDETKKEDVIEFVPYGLRRYAARFNGVAKYALNVTYVTSIIEITKSIQ